jgi:uncharacterized glyoxalase superfamily protein PhnB
MPPGDVIPEIPYRNIAEAVAWLCPAFGFRERLRIADHRAQISVGSGAVVAVQEDAPAGRCSVMVRVNDVDAHHETALRHGARILDPPATHPFGERQYSAEDFAGHRWVFSQTVADVDPAEWGGQLIG